MAVGADHAQQVVCIVGPTGAGKTAAALHVARTFGGGVVNADSRQLYRDFPIITAQPTAEEQGVCPHLLYGFLPTSEKVSAGAWSDMAITATATLAGQGLLPLLVGGTGLYLRALLDGIVAIPTVDEAIMVRLETACDAEGSAVLHRRLAEVDPAYAARIHPNDRQRIVRALGVWEGTGQTFSWWHAQPVAAAPFRVLRIGIGMSLDELTPRLAHRIDLMLEAGALAEARAALELCDDAGAPGWSGIGCAELYDYLAGRCSMAAARTLWLRNTRAYAKRQLTWFRADARIRWFRPDDVNGVAAAVAAFRDTGLQ